MENGAQKYFAQQLMTAGPAQLVVMMYDRVILSLKESIAAIERKDIEGRWRANARAIEIISHMWTTLNVENGGEIAANLDSLFPYMLRRLPEVDMKNDPAPAQEVIGLLEPLRDAWRQIASGTAAGGQATAGRKYPSHAAGQPQGPESADVPDAPMPTRISA